MKQQTVLLYCYMSVTCRHNYRWYDA